MSAYIVARADVDDPALLKDYMAATPPIIAKCRGKFIARGGSTAPSKGLPSHAALSLSSSPSCPMRKRSIIPRSMRTRGNPSRVSPLPSLLPLKVLTDVFGVFNTDA